MREVTRTIASKGVSLSSIAKSTNISNRQVEQSLKYLQEIGYVQKNDDKYVLSHPLLESKILTDSSALKTKYSLDNPPGTREKRVYVGGNYDFMATIRELMKCVKECGFEPIMAYDFDVPKDKIHEYDLKLLSKCKRALFEVSSSNGYHYEIDDCLHRRTSCLLLYQIRDETAMSNDSVSHVLTTISIDGVKPKIKGYVTFADAKEKISGWLS
jgi:biotin operon repressor